MLRNLRGGLELLVLRRPPSDRFVRSFDQLLALLVLSLALWATLDTLHAPGDSQFALEGLYGWPCYLLLGLLACALVARANSPDTDTRAVLIPALSVLPYVLIVFWLLSDLSGVKEWPLAAAVVAVVYLSILGLRVARAAFGSVSGRVAIVTVALAVLSPVLLEIVDLDTRLWVEPDEDQTADSDDASTEEPLLYDQPAQIAAALDRVAPGKSGTPAVYFVGFAGDGDQAIFKREALFAQQVFDEHFGSGRRSVQLINDVDDRDAYPLASVTGLEQTLKGLASRMNTEQDVLVLTLTSHGSQEGLEVTNGSLPLLQLDPADLREALDQSGIKWRVVIVSACYAGVFLDALKSDTTLVITAADAEHSSFGCDDDRDLTYFGEAFLKDSVPTTHTLEEAFKKAAGLIQKRETDEHKVHSNPQFYAGPLIRQKLTEIESRQPQRDEGSFTVRK